MAATFGGVNPSKAGEIVADGCSESKKGTEIETKLVPLLTRNHHSNQLYNPLPLLLSVIF